MTTYRIFNVESFRNILFWPLILGVAGSIFYVLVTFKLLTRYLGHGTMLVPKDRRLAFPPFSWNGPRFLAFGMTTQVIFSDALHSMRSPIPNFEDRFLVRIFPIEPTLNTLSTANTAPYETEKANYCAVPHRTTGEGKRIRLPRKNRGIYVLYRTVPFYPCAEYRSPTR